MSDYSVQLNKRILGSDEGFLGNARYHVKAFSTNAAREANCEWKSSKVTASSAKKDLKQQDRQLGRKLRVQLQTQAHLRKMPYHANDFEYEHKLCKVATLGFLKFLTTASHRVHRKTPRSNKGKPLGERRIE
eukprot:CAMPEP_0201527068 /NCGR_PEP_ID=MMETSP0161_2-20130828/33873_1 /ASSEMBLY_ACC=CAM_ASM_000251 /TAXON_ID=180227 /ORGANISM="Neoparamoeba aestuarina, Strain SoJaBio B1-5/56/2" /LENGTH=131 /DNA_ID=CAMNT_0047927719 /DNA_START=706 /DNA_END=1101 /DNA_ORIENTATION=+